MKAKLTFLYYCFYYRKFLSIYRVDSSITPDLIFNTVALQPITSCQTHYFTASNGRHVILSVNIQYSYPKDLKKVFQT